MTNMVRFARFALMGASLLALTSPVLAGTAGKSDRLNCYQVAGLGGQCAVPASLSTRERARERSMQVPNADLRYGPQPAYPQSPPGGGY